MKRTLLIFYFSSKYSEHIILTKAAKEIFFFYASSLSLLYNSEGILIFNTLSFNVSPPLIYKNSRDAARQFLIKHNVRSLPVDLKSITAEMGIIVRRDVLGILKSGERGKTADANGQPLIIVEKSPVSQTRYTILHEIGHIVLGHRALKELTKQEEYAAERFAIGVLATACVLWRLNVKTANEIAALCNISFASAKIREKRMQELYARNKFLTSPLER